MDKFLESFEDIKRVEFSEGEVVLEEGSKIKTIDFLIEGNIYISRNLKDGKRVIANNLEAPQILSLIEVLNGEDEVMSGVFALNKVAILKVQKDEFLNKLRGGELRDIALEYLSKFSYNIIKNSIEYEEYEVEKAILKYYLKISKGSELGIINLKNAFVADMFRISERTLYRYLNSWEEKGLISRKKRSIVICDTNRKKICEFLDK
ncbi:Crp/Fnr family transcriptional regulator [Peptoniphilus indolicus]|uniref:DNA-binding transcriptional activator YeiL n=1 Tax=Peptoniphilus indolicus TaxID=33030 RepID=A0A379DAZ9_9FIRM|nr:Crp/Fnr family transcriptional regulator [Peptoniphilus indolicus]SUB75097.1 DNA-binding transcriptional activator YeiL [Peptoniphilus indolicus]